MRTRAQAIKEGKRWKALLKNPKGWRIDVWKSGNWCVALRKGGMNLMNSSGFADFGVDSFWTLFSEDGAPCGNSVWTDDFKHRDPNLVIEHQLGLVKDYVKKCQSAIRKAS